MTVAIEDYVKVIYGHTEWQPEPITPSQLAARMGLAASSVTEMVRRLASLGLVSHVKYGAVTLTDEGRTLALRIVRRHRLIESWLVGECGYRWDEVHDEAEVLEHAVSDRLLDALEARLGHPAADPHGDPIPTADGELRMPRAVPLAEAPVGASALVRRISDRDPAMLRHFAEHGVTIDATIEVRGRQPYGGAFAITVAGTEVDLGDEAVAAIWVEPVG